MTARPYKPTSAMALKDTGAVGGNACGMDVWSVWMGWGVVGMGIRSRGRRAVWVERQRQTAALQTWASGRRRIKMKTDGGGPGHSLAVVLACASVLCGCGCRSCVTLIDESVAFEEDLERSSLGELPPASPSHASYTHHTHRDRAQVRQGQGRGEWACQAAAAKLQRQRERCCPPPRSSHSSSKNKKKACFCASAKTTSYSQSPRNNCASPPLSSPSPSVHVPKPPS